MRRNVYFIVLSSVFVLIIAAGIYFMVTFNVSAELITASLTSILAVASIMLGKYMDTLTSEKNKQREKKAEFYEKFVRIIFSSMKQQKGTKGKNVPANQEIVDELWNVMQYGIVWASNDFLRSWASFRQISTSNEVDPIKLFNSVSGLLLTIREDLGYSSRGMKPSILLSSLLNDVDKLVNNH